MRKLPALIGSAVLSAACGFVGLAAHAADPADTMMSDTMSGATPAAKTAAGGAAALTPAQTQFFETKVRPVLSARCYKCHSVQEGKSKGGLVLDTREGWQKGGESGAVIKPGDPDKSPLIKAVSYSDPDLQMPPKGDKLSAQEVATLTEWVKMGAPDPRTTTGGSKLTGLNDKARAHWAYQPVKPQTVPSVNNPAFVKTPVDAFALEKLQKNGMTPNPPAAREVLIRRAYYDLTGMPPTPEQVRAFVSDPAPDAFEKVVDQLLASPAYGERWGRFWLDSARYSDTTGVDQVRRDDYRYAHAWTYRDYVIKSFNDDKPYNQFLLEQIAADQLPTARTNPDSLAALGFITVGKRFQNPNDQIDERIDALTKSTMAMTVACARCHDHKFDPIPTADYYSLHGIFVSTIEPDEKPLIGPEPKGPEYEDFKKQLAVLEQKDKELYFDLLDGKSTEFRRKAADYLMVTILGRRQNNADDQKERTRIINSARLDRDLYQTGFLRGGGGAGGALAPLFRFSQLPADGFADRAKAVLAEITADRGGALADAGRGEGRLRRGGFGGGGFGGGGFGQGGAGGMMAGGRFGGVGRGRPNALVTQAFKDVKPESLKSMADVAAVYGKLFASIDDKAKAYLKACRTATTDQVTGFDEDLVELASLPAPIEPAPRMTTAHLRELAPRLPVANQGGYNRFLFAQINELELTHPGAPARAMVVADARVGRDSPVFIRGEAQNRGPIVPRRFLEILAGPNRQSFKVGSGRLELAKAIATKDNPLTARVMVNRVWTHHFGEGFVRTLDDMGVQSEPPSHPELLDYLAGRFVEDGWSVKKLHKLIMLSSTYQLASDTNPYYSQKDPDNRLLWRQNLRRLDFEAVRDTMLQFTGKLDLTVGGKPVNLTDEPYSNRRSVYGYIDRGSLPELMAQFDFSDPDMANSRRATTIVPQQALFFMNSPMAADVARKVTQRSEFLEAKDDPARVKALYAVLFQRAPKPEEVRLAMQFVTAAKDDPIAKVAPSRLDERGRRFAGRQGMVPPGVAQRRGNGRSAIQNEGEMVDRKPLAAWEQYAQALLFTNEIAYVN